MPRIKNSHLRARGIGKELHLGFIQDTNSRYYRMPRLKDPATGFTTIRMYRRHHSSYLMKRKKYYMVTSGTEFRPDLLAFDVYQNPFYWWRIFEANHLRGIEDLRAGKTLVVPDQGTLNLHFSVNVEEIFA